MDPNVGNISKNLWNFGIPYKTVIQVWRKSPHITLHFFQYYRKNLVKPGFFFL